MMVLLKHTLLYVLVITNKLLHLLGENVLFLCFYGRIFDLALIMLLLPKYIYISLAYSRMNLKMNLSCGTLFKITLTYSLNEARSLK